MKTLRFLLFAGFFLSGVCGVFGQEGGTLDEISYSLKDTLLADSLLKEGISSIENLQYDLGKIQLKSAEKIFGQIPEKALDLSEIFYWYGVMTYYQGDYTQTEEHWQKALNIRMDVLGPNSLPVAKSYNNLGILHEAKFKYDRAIDYYEKSLKIHFESLDSNHINIASVYNNLGNVYNRTGELMKSVDLHSKALKIQIDNYGENHGSSASKYLNLANAISSLGDYRKALTYYQKALNVVTDTYGETYPQLAIIYYGLGDLYSTLFENDKSVNLLLKGINIQKKTGGESHPNLAVFFDRLGDVYMDSRDFESAEKAFLNALKVREKNFEKDSFILSYSYFNLANINAFKENYDLAKKYHHEVLKIRQNALGKEHSSVGFSLRNIGSIHFAQKEFNLSLEFYEKALSIFKKTYEQGHPEILRTLRYIAQNHFSMNNIDVALNVIKNSEAACEIQSKKYGQATVYSEKVKNFEHSGRFLRQYSQTRKNSETWLYSSINKYDLAIKQLWKIRSKSSVKFKGEENEVSQLIYEGALLTNHDAFLLTDSSHYLNQSFKISEFSKSLLLYQSLLESNALRFAGIPDTLLQKEYALRIEITYYDKKRQKKLSQGLDETDTNVLKISSKLFDLNQEYEALKKQFETDYPDYYNLKYDLSTASLEYIQDTLLSENQSLLEYFVGDSSVFLFVVKPNDYQVIEVKKDFPLEDWVKDLQFGIFGAYGSENYTNQLYGESIQKYIETAPKLYEKLIAPVTDMLTEEVILIPDGVLGYVPFEALLKSKPTAPRNFNSYPFLIKDHRFSYCYSATLLREMKEKKHKKTPSKSLLAFAPFYEGSYEKLNELFGAELDTLSVALDLPGFEDIVTRKSFKQLPNSGEEVLAASKIWNGDIYLNEQATEDKFNAVSGDYKIIHLSTHGIADSRIGDYSYLAFAEQKDSIENEYLYVRDLYNLQLNADLVVLSACETATGELQRGEGIISLARAFAYAGAKSILTTLWVVDDASTKELTKQFYIRLKKGDRKDLALQKAKLKILKQKENKGKHPFFWAAMIPVGDMAEMN